MFPPCAHADGPWPAWNWSLPMRVHATHSERGTVPGTMPRWSRQERCHGCSKSVEHADESRPEQRPLDYVVRWPVPGLDTFSDAPDGVHVFEDAVQKPGAVSVVVRRCRSHLSSKGRAINLGHVLEIEESQSGRSILSIVVHLRMTASADAATTGSAHEGPSSWSSRRSNVRVKTWAEVRRWPISAQS